MYDALARHRAIEALVVRDSSQGQLRKYYRFRADRWYGGIATGDVVGCGLLCRFCWASDTLLAVSDTLGVSLSPQEAARKILRIAEDKRLTQMRLSGGEPTLGRRHLLDVLSEVEKAGRFRFILETNGILLGADPSYCGDLAGFRCLHVRVSIKGACGDDFARLTGANSESFAHQLDALKNLVEAGVSCHAAVMSSFSTRDTLRELKDRISTIAPRLVDDLEVEELIRYPRVERRLRKFGLSPCVSHDPRNVPERLV